MNAYRAPFQYKEGKGEFGKRLKDERIRRGFRLERFAAEVGVDHTAISGYENRGCEPKLSILVEMARVLDCSLDYLCGLEES